MSFPDNDALALSGRRLSRLLSRWADARCLDPRQIDAIRQAARAAPVELGFDWWWRLLDPEFGSVFRATASRPTFGSTPGLVDGTSYAIGSPGRMAWAHDDAEYQPYLCLT
jgi:hypothetical protein